MVQETDPPDGGDDGAAGRADGSVDYGWVMQVTFVLAIVLGAPIVAVLSVGATLPTWEARVSFAVRVGAVVWLCTAVGVFLYACRRSRHSEA